MAQPSIAPENLHIHAYNYASRLRSKPDDDAELVFLVTTQATEE
jgi:hypothetical protein